MRNHFVNNFRIYLLLIFSVILNGCVSANHGEFGSVSIKDYTPSNDYVLKKRMHGVKPKQFIGRFIQANHLSWGALLMTRSRSMMDCL